MCRARGKRRLVVVGAAVCLVLGGSAGAAEPVDLTAKTPEWGQSFSADTGDDIGVDIPLTSIRAGFRLRASCKVPSVRLTQNSGTWEATNVSDDGTTTTSDQYFTGDADGGRAEMQGGISFNVSVFVDPWGDTGRWEKSIVDCDLTGIYESDAFDPFLLTGSAARPLQLSADLASKEYAGFKIGGWTWSVTPVVEIGVAQDATIRGNAISVEGTTFD